MDWFMLTAMAIGGWAVVSVLAGERLARQQQMAAETARRPAAETVVAA